MNEAERYLREYQQKIQSSYPPQSPQANTSQHFFRRQRTVSAGEAWNCFWTRWTFNGRASRSEYWWMQLLLFLVNFGLGFVQGFCGAIDPMLGGLFGVVVFIFQILTIIPNLCLLIRRLHDTDHSGWWYWLLLIPIVGWLILFIFTVTGSDLRENRFGAIPNSL